MTSRLPAGHSLSLSLGSEQLVATDGGSLTLSAGQPITQISLLLPELAIFDAANVRPLMA